MRTAGFGRRLAALSLLGSVASLNLEQLAAVQLRRVVVGDGDALARLADEPAVLAGSLWRTSGAVLYASRRPAWPWCREEAQDLCTLLDRMRAEGPLSAAVPVIGIIKAPLASEEEEVASQANGWPPSTTGVATFRRDYFNCIQAELYADEAQEAYALLGNRKLKLPWRKVLTRPWAAWRDLQAITARTEEKGVVAQSGGEGAVLGGICIIGPQDVTEPSYVYREEIGSPIPAGEIEEAIRAVLGA